MQSTYSGVLSEIKLYRSKMVIQETQLEHFLKYLDDSVFKKGFLFCNPEKSSVTPSFARAFGTLSDLEKADYYLACLKVINEYRKNRDWVVPEERSRQKVELLFRQDNKQWKKVVVLISYKQSVIQVESLGFKIKMQNYIYRLSNTKAKYAFVLESTNVECEPQTVRFGLSKKEDFDEVLLKMKALVMGGLRQKIAKAMGLARESRDYVDSLIEMKEGMTPITKGSIQQGHKSLRLLIKAKNSVELSNKQTGTEQKPQEFVQNELIAGLNNFQKFEHIDNGLFVHHEKEVIRKISIFQASGVSVEWFAKELTNFEHFSIWKSSLCSISMIGDVHKENTQFYHEIDVYKDGQEVDYVYYRQRINKDKVVYFIDRSISTAQYGSHQTSSSRGKIQYCIWRIKQTNGLIQLLVECCVTHIPCSDHYQAMNEQIGQLQNLPLCLNPTLASKRLNKPKISFFSIDEKDAFNGVEIAQPVASQIHLKAINFSKTPESDFYSIMDKESQLNFNELPRQSSFSTVTNMNQPNYRYKLQPYEPQSRQYKLLRKNKFFDEDECVTNDIGDLVFTNKEKIKAQSTVITSVLKKMGHNLFSGKSVLNVSFPIQIFAADTNMERLCKGMAYAPLFLQKKIQASPLERIKAVICFALGNLLLYIDMAKPFNPILGETYQGFIDGCPIYGEQTSHHPPISSLFMHGRDYFVSGNIEATVDLGMNTVSGTNAGQYKVAFHKTDPNKNAIIFTCPPGKLSGVIYGERKLNIVQKSRFFDPENRLYCELQWGSKKSKNPVSRYHDYLQGKIVELNKPATKLAKVKQSEKDTVLGYITGRWTETIYFNQEPIFEVNKLRPFVPTEQTMPLGSDSRLRSDRMYVQKGRLAEAQTAKEQLQEIQRNDRKLRKDYQK